MTDDDEANWAEAEALLARWRPEPVERRLARDRRDQQLFVAAMSLAGAAVLLALVLLAVDPPPDPGGEPPTWRGVTGLVVAGLGLLFVAVAAVLRVPRRQAPLKWGRPLGELTRQQRRELVRQVRGRSPLAPDRVGLARQTTEELLFRRGGVVIQTGLAVVFSGSWIGDRSLWRTILTLVFLTLYTVAAVQAWRDGRAARRFLEQHPYPEP